MRLSLLLHYPGSPEQVAALLADRGFVEEMCAGSDATSWEVDVDGDPAGAFTVTVTRSLPTAGMPDVAARFVGPSLRLHQVDRWEAPGPDGARTGTTALEVVGAPVRARAATALRPGTDGTDHSLEGDLTASVPLLGGRVERAAEPPLVTALREQEAAVTARLAH